MLLAMYTATCRDRDFFRLEREAARLAPEATSCLQEEMKGVKKVCDDMQDKPESGCQKASADARQEVL